LPHHGTRDLVVVPCARIARPKNLAHVQAAAKGKSVGVVGLEEEEEEEEEEREEEERGLG
jgi:hypothetical protein